MPEQHHHPLHGDQNTQNFLNKIAFLDSDTRQKQLPPLAILQPAAIEPTDRVLDMGAGTGYLAIPAAKQTKETVFALDLDPRMLAILRTKAQMEQLPNLQPLQGNLTAIPLPDNAVEVALASLILHEVEDLPLVLSQTKRVLKPGGRFLCLEYEKEESALQGPPLSIRIPSAKMKQELELAGFSSIEKKYLQPGIYLLLAHNRA